MSDTTTGQQQNQQQQPAQNQPAAGTEATGPQRPEGVSEAEWGALGDPGKTALVRERERANAAERALAAARSTQAPKQEPKKDEPKSEPAKSEQKNETPDFAALIKSAVAEAVAPILDRDQQREVAQAAERIRETVLTSAKERFHDPTDAVIQVDLSTLTDGAGAPDQAKITAALDDLLKRKPHLGRVVDDRRRAAPGSGVGATGGATAPLDDRVKATLARMQSASGVKFAGNP